MRPHTAGEQRVSVGMRRRHARATDRAAAAADVLDDQRLPENLSHLVGDHARHHVARTASGERHHHSDRSDGIAIPCPIPCHNTSRDRRNAQESSERDYEKLSRPHKTNPSVTAPAAALVGLADMPLNWFSVVIPGPRAAVSAAQACVVVNSGFFVNFDHQPADATCHPGTRHTVPMTSGSRQITDAGGLMSYGASIT